MKKDFSGIEADSTAPYPNTLTIDNLADATSGYSKDMGNGMLLKWRVDKSNYSGENTLEFYREKKK